MAKQLFTTVHLTGENGKVSVFGPMDDLPEWAEKKLSEDWGDDRSDLWGDDDSNVAPEELHPVDALALGHPLPVGAGVVQGDDRTEAAMEVAAEVRTEEGRQAAFDAGFSEDDLKDSGSKKASDSKGMREGAGGKRVQKEAEKAVPSSE